MRGTLPEIDMQERRRMANIARIVAGVGALTGGYLRGRDQRREQDWQDEQRAQARRKWADDEALRKAIAGEPEDRNAAVLTNSATDLADASSAASGGAVPRSAELPAMPAATVSALGVDGGSVDPGSMASVVGQGVNPRPTPKDPGPDHLEHYLNRIAPRVQQELIRQGKLGDAKAFQDLLDSTDGKTYTRNWANAVRKIETGDLDGAVPDLERLYTSFPDGQRAQATKLDGGKYQIDMIDEASGKTVNSFTLESGQLVRKAAMALRPEKLAEFLATQQGKREAEAASLDKSLQLEGLRQEGQEAREDRRDERLAARLDANAAALEKRLAADAERRASGGGLTAAQQRSNAEIDAAREAVAGLSPQEIRDRTQQYGKTGRINENFDPGLARQAALAGRRKIGDDGLLDAPKPKPAAPAFDRADVAKRFRADRTMDNRTLGKETPNGIEVLEKGKLIGYFR